MIAKTALGCSCWPNGLLVLHSKDGEKREAKGSAALTNIDALYAVHSTLMTCVTPEEEWHSLGEGS